MSGRKRSKDDLIDLVREGVDALLDEGRAVRDKIAENAAARARKRPTPAERLLQRRERKRRSIRSHTQSYISVILGLAVINIVTGLAAGELFPWFLIVAAAWGMGYGMHLLGWRSWLEDNRAALAAAEAEVAQLPAPSRQELIEGTAPRTEAPPGQPGVDPAWQALLERCRRAVQSADAALADAGSASGAETSHRLKAGLVDVEQLATGAEKVRRALAEIAPEGTAGLEAEVARLDARINAAADERLRGVYLANRTLLQARRAKVEALRAERERMAASAEGFLLAVENVRLDAARIGAGHVPALHAALGDTLDRLSAEVGILRQVEEELEAL